MRALLPLLVGAFVLVAVAAARNAETPRPAAGVERSAESPLLGVMWGEESGRLLRFAPRTLEPLPGPSLEIGRLAYPWAFSPGGSRLAFAFRDGFPEVRVVDAERLSPLGSFDLGGAGNITALAWPERRKLVAVLGGEIVVADPVAGRTIRRTPLAGAVLGFRALRSGLVLLLAPAGRIGRARLTLVDANGRVASVALLRIRAGFGSRRGPGDLYIGTQRDPGLAVEPGGWRAVVIGPDELAAEIDLPTLRVRYHTLGRRRSLLARIFGWLEPEAQAKVSTGPSRSAAWVGEDTIVVWGEDFRASVRDDGSFRGTNAPGGVELVDVRDWTVRTVDERAPYALVSRGAIAAFGARRTYGSDIDAVEGVGLTVYDTDGRRRFRLFDDEPIWSVEAVGAYAYVGPGRDGRLRVVDLRSGKIVREVVIPWWPQLFAGRAAEWS